GVAATMNRRFDDAEAHFLAAAADAARIGARPELARSCLDHARMLAVRAGRGDRERAARLLREGSSLFAALHIRRFEDRAPPLATTLHRSLPRRRAEPPSPHGLSEREVEILRRIARGRTDEEIAADLVLSPALVAHHVRAIYARLGVDTRVGAAAFAFESGLG